MFYASHAPVYHTPGGTPYLKGAGVVLLSQPNVCVGGVDGFLEPFIADGLDFDEYLDDPTELDDATQAVKFAGQLCYMSFGKARSVNAKAGDYIKHILKSGHGSVLEHVNFSFLIYGGDRSYTHEAVRHRSGCAYSQESQRYVDGKVLRFVERVEYQDDPDLHAMFEQRIDRAADEYDRIAERLRLIMAADPAFAAKSRTEQRKAVNQAARSCLPNETEAIIMVTANARAWRHIIEMRASSAADRPIRSIAFKQLQILREVAPLLFGDYVLDEENESATTEFRKV